MKGQVLPVRNDTALSLPSFADWDVDETNIQLDVVEIIFSVEHKSSFLTLVIVVTHSLNTDHLPAFSRAFNHI